jgi:Leucine-rich repeat (LRR) protein
MGHVLKCQLYAKLAQQALQQQGVLKQALHATSFSNPPYFPQPHTRRSDDMLSPLSSCLVPPAQVQLSALERLNASENQLSELPPGLASCSSLQVLSLGGNQLELLPEDIGQAPVLVDLDLRCVCVRAEGG